MDSGIPQKSDSASQSMGYPVDQFGRPINPDLSSEVNSSPTNDPVDMRLVENSSRVGSIATSAYSSTMEVGPQKNGAVRGEHIPGGIVRSGEQNQPSIPGNKEQDVSLDRNLLRSEAPVENGAGSDIATSGKVSNQIPDIRQLEKGIEDTERWYNEMRTAAHEYTENSKEEGHE